MAMLHEDLHVGVFKGNLLLESGIDPQRERLGDKHDRNERKSYQDRKACVK
jgi:hypothetical protein